MHFLITGTTGFIGQQLARQVVERGHTFAALVRDPQLHEARELPAIRSVKGDLTTGEGLVEALRGVDCVVHLAACKTGDTVRLFRVNAVGSRRLYAAVAVMSPAPRVVYCSSLAAAGPARAGHPRREEQPPAPLSPYGRSKLAGEQALRAVSDRVAGVVVRPPLVYGPGDRDLLPPLIAMVRRHVFLTCGAGARLYSLIHVDDLCRALLAAAERGRTLSRENLTAGVYTVSDGVEHDARDIGAELARALSRRPPRLVRVPAGVAWLGAAAAELLLSRNGWRPVINRDTIREARCEAWTCTIDRAVRDLQFQPEIRLREGLRRTLEDPSMQRYSANR
ncbi:epimerase [Longimycelium tulufanense]|uniref:Epimerase n=1 Tax=Longimycelium tulufanense TaxID=907463 RepID=A0A8J3CC03_9PSEU|nr:NAD(P)-dependent oxidoreductase [Longimycelium tulufanense]GGM51197.1 epimerase [Longimycelium tulufanense]